jgi:hypothetical protein
MYRPLASHIYPEGYTYSGPAVECYYSFYVSKDFAPKDVASNVIEQSQVGAAGEGATILTTEAWVDESEANNLYSVKFNAYGPGLSSEANTHSISAPISQWQVWVLRIILVAIIAFTTIYVINTIRDISYSPSGPAMWSALKWISIGIAALAGVYIISKFLPGKARNATRSE